ncbi:TetR/AcrR family transcriptional regulator [Kineococcus sp. SYSU DK001]|uniref:TetR/AcrR family transcriptional regulator n=1 Tax=Kineococcus sp. SYSU DK001 TaxID=3383122 RepID=UPI003D7CE2B0
MARPRTVSDEAIHAATAAVLRRHGLQGTTVAAVAAQAGLSAAGLVQRVGSKRRLLLDFARRSLDDGDTCFAAARDGARSPLQALRAALVAMTEPVRERTELANSLSFLQLDLVDEEFRSIAAAHAHRVQQRIAELLGEAVAAGELRPGVDATALARTVHLTHNGVLTVWPLTGTGPLEDDLRAAVDAVLAPHLAPHPARPTRGTRP